MDKPTCKVRGMVAPNAMCGHIIVGMKYCGFSGDCQHKSVAEAIVKLVRETAEQDRSAAISAAKNPDERGSE